MSSEADRDYIAIRLLSELQDRMDAWAKEYQQERDLGARGEFVGLYRKVRKIKTIVWDGVPEDGFREGVRTMLFEIIAHALLMLTDWDRETGKTDEEPDDKLPPQLVEMEPPAIVSRPRPRRWRPAGEATDDGPAE